MEPDGVEWSRMTRMDSDGRRAGDLEQEGLGLGVVAAVAPQHAEVVVGVQHLRRGAGGERRASKSRRWPAYGASKGRRRLAGSMAHRPHLALESRRVVLHAVQRRDEELFPLRELFGFDKVVPQHQLDPRHAV